MVKIFKNSVVIVISGIIIAVLIGLLSLYGNPINMGLCEVNFVRDIAGSLRLHSMPTFQYFRPEIAGIILGSFIISILTKKFKLAISKAGVAYAVFGFFTMMLGMIFLGSPLRTIERMAGGDLNALVGFIGLILGMAIGDLFIKNGFSVREKERTYEKGFGRYILPLALIILLAIMVVDTYARNDADKLLKASASGPASVHAGVIISIVFSIIIGILLEMTDLSFDNAYKSAVHKKDFAMIISGICMFIVLLALSIISYNFNLDFDGQIVAHKAHVWNFLSMFGIGMILMLADGDPLRQMVKAGEGSIDSMLYIAGMFVACIIIYPFKLTSSAYSMLPNGTWFVGGPIKNGIVATILSLVVIICIGILGKKEKQGRK